MACPRPAPISPTAASASARAAWTRRVTRASACPSASYSFIARHPDDTQNAALGAGPVDTALTTNGQVVEVTLTLQAAGAVKGTIVRPDGSTLAGGFPYEIRVLNGSTRAFKSGQTTPTGVFRTGALPLGAYLLTAYDPQANRFADQEFQITADGEEVQIDLVVEDNRIQLPANLFDANRMRFDVQQGGELETGHFWTYDGAGVKLEVNGQAFTGDASALLEAGKRQFAITQDTPLAGLEVTRKIFVPRGAYFARYLEVFENPTAAPITVDARLTSRFKAATIIGSSTGDTALTPLDDWVVLDDATNEDPALVDEQQPATAHVFGAAGAAKAIDEAAFDLGGDGKGTMVQRWSGAHGAPGRQGHADALRGAADPPRGRHGLRRAAGEAAAGGDPVAHRQRAPVDRELPDAGAGRAGSRTRCRRSRRRSPAVSSRATA